jgi:hypothetical protein
MLGTGLFCIIRLSVDENWYVHKIIDVNIELKEGGTN